MDEPTLLAREYHRALREVPPDTFVVLERSNDRPKLVGLLSPKEQEIPLDAQLFLRPDIVQGDGLSFGLHKLVPIYWGMINVGWLIYLPALQISVGRNYIKILRAKGIKLGSRDRPRLALKLQSVIVVEVPDSICMILSTSTGDV